MGNLAYGKTDSSLAHADLLPVISLLFSLLQEKSQAEGSGLGKIMSEPEVLETLITQLGLGELLWDKGE